MRQRKRRTRNREADEVEELEQVWNYRSRDEETVS
jgi:hypothetical protein